MAGVVGDATLPAAVAAAGGHGMFPATFVSAPYLAHVLDDLDLATRAYGVNFIPIFLDPAAFEIAVHRARLVDFFLGEPDQRLVEQVHAGGALAGWQVVSREQAVAAEAVGCDLVIAQGVEAGGHPGGQLGLLPLLDEVVNAVTVPVVAAGGVGSARTAAAALAAGASAVRVGTRFIAATESRAHPAYKAALVAARAADAVLTREFSVGDPMESVQRVLASSLEAAHAQRADPIGEIVIGGMRIPAARLGSLPPTEGSSGAVEAMALYAGQSVGAIRAVTPAAEIVAELAAGARLI
jgi:nitronate monooxygenase